MSKGHTTNDDPTGRAARAKQAYEATVRGFHGRDRTPEEIAEEKRRRDLEGDSHGVPIDHVGFSEKDQRRLKNAARADAGLEPEEDTNDDEETGK